MWSCPGGGQDPADYEPAGQGGHHDHRRRQLGFTGELGVQVESVGWVRSRGVPTGLDWIV